MTLLRTGAPAWRPVHRSWRPALLRSPASLTHARRDWQPVLVRLRLPTTVGLLVAFLALQFLIPARLVIGGMGAVGRPAEAVGVLLAFLWALSFVRPHGLPPGPQPIRWVIGGFIAVQLVGYGVAYDRGLPAIEASSADRWLIFIVAMAGITLATADGLATRRQLDRVLMALVGFAAVMAFIGVLQFVGIADLTQYLRFPGLRANADLIGVGERGGPGFARIASTATHFIEFGVVLAMVLPLALHYALFAASPWQRMWRRLAAALVAVGVPLSISRSATLAVVVAMAASAVVWPWRQRYNALVIGICAIAAFQVVQPGVLGTIRSLFANVQNDPSIQNRLSDTEYVMDLFEERPWLGRGAGTVIPERYILLDNQLYMTLLAGGIIGLAGLVLFLVVPYFVARSLRLRGADQETRHLAQALAAVLPVALVVSATFDSLSFATFTGVLFLVIGAIGALWRLDGGGRTHRPLQPAGPDDRFVATPWMASWRPSVLARPGHEDPIG